MSAKELGSILKSIRIKKRISTVKVELFSNPTITRGHLHHIESGKIKNINPSHITALTKLYKCQERWTEFMAMIYELPPSQFRGYDFQCGNDLGELNFHEERAVEAFLRTYRNLKKENPGSYD